MTAKTRVKFNSIRKEQIYFAVIVVTCLYIIIVLSFVPLKSKNYLFFLKPFHYVPKRAIPTWKENSTDTKTVNSHTILYWTKSFDGPKWYGDGAEPFKECEFDNCFFTSNKSKYDESKAVLFHMRFLVPFPKYKVQGQKWIMQIMEPPAREKSYTRYNKLFNATWTYHRKSDIWTNYSSNYFKKTHVDELRAEVKNYANGKDRLVAWFVSHCKVASKREVYVRELMKFVKVDIYGKCGRLSCSRKKNETACDEMLNHYKFYLAFENSICEDYLTEKIWRPYKYNVVPIVLGGFDYASFFPPNSYIDVKDYTSPKELAKQLRKLDKDDTEYNKYFEWKTSYQLVKTAPPQCHLCEYLNKSVNTTKTYHRLDLFWNKTTDCQNPEEFYKKIDKNVWKELN